VPQVAEAFLLDIGLSSPLKPSAYGDCTAVEVECLAAPSGAAPGTAELSGDIVRLVRDYVAALPASASVSAAGLALFTATGCAACHVPALGDPQGGPVRAFTDLLLHDLGPELDDGVGEAGVASREWRTPPLTALAFAKGRRYLHDARAVSVDAAVRAHGGEGRTARAR
jgi:CxxC motif-containing protein (DUF1111 family)